MPMNFDIHDLVAFRAVAELGSFRKAAESIHISQPAFSRRIEKLEQALDARLLDRTTRKVNLTPIGREFDKQLRHILDALDATLLNIRGVAATRMGEVTVACVPSAVNYFLSDVVKVFHDRYPKTRVRVLDDSGNKVLMAVEEGEADFGLSFTGSQESNIEFTPIFEDKFVAACRKDHPVAKLKSVRWSELAEHNYISYSKVSGNRLLLDQALAGLLEQPRSLYETQHGTTMIGLVEAGLGVAAVPAMAVPRKGHPLLVSVPLTNPEVTRIMGLIRRRSGQLTPAAQQLYDLFLNAKRLRKIR
ncbi:MAG: LysR family transcriptional regulator [Hydrogenophaga sp.]|uniref:LysR family transcriptional regulator n=1 Tax=Hydrogenophaga sp. TaxID=1904254 RepID=UPI002AB93E1E|nr:LysR family transcriptional regulator [Hydrogenophaga sp.]MDZ4188334.1 LysR family transcriptional regulator [Hydrogenophaga sp.]